MKEVFVPQEANRVAIISESFGRKKILEKVYFYLNKNETMSSVLEHIKKYYGYLIDVNIRIDFYYVRNGLTIGRE